MPAKFLEALNQGMRRAIESDPNVVLFGEDLLDPYGGAFKVTKGLQASFPSQVITTPISEAVLAALAGGMALRGLRPIVELMFGDFITLTADQIVNHISKYRVMYGNQVKCAPLFRVPVGAGRGYGPTHSQSLEKMFFGVPHLRVVAPSLFHEPAAMIEASSDSNEAVLFLEHKLLYPLALVDESTLPAGLRMQRIGDRPFETVRVDNFPAGKPDVVLLTYGGTTRTAVKLLQRLADEEFNVSLIIVALVNTPDWKLLGEISQEASYGTIVWEESTSGFDWGAEVAAHLAGAEWPRRLPVVRLASMPTVVPSAKELESVFLITDEDVERQVAALVSGTN